VGLDGRRIQIDVSAAILPFRMRMKSSPVWGHQNSFVVFSNWPGPIAIEIEMMERHSFHFCANRAKRSAVAEAVSIAKAMLMFAA
jgi:hypothetical protein